MILIATFLICLEFLTVSASDACPAAKNIYPCDCINEFDYVEIRCLDKDLSRDKLIDILKLVDPSEEILLNVKNMDLGSLPSNFFDGLRITKIEIENCKLENLAADGGKPFAGLENVLRELDIISTFTEENSISLLDFSHLNKLTDLFLVGNVFKDLDDLWFINGPTSLLQLVLLNNGFEQIGHKIFTNLLRLQVLKFEGNRFNDHLARSMFPNPAKLEELELNNNGLKWIREDLFSNMPLLRKLTLKDNLITRVEEKSFGPIWPQLEILDLRGNPLDCDERIDWMKGKDKKPDHVVGTCRFPDDKSGTELQDLM